MNAMCGDFVELVQLSFAMAPLATLRRIAVGHHRYRGPWRGNRRSAPTIDLPRGSGAASGGSGQHRSAHNNRLNHKSLPIRRRRAFGRSGTGWLTRRGK